MDTVKKEIPLSSSVDGDMTYGEFRKRRAALVSEIRRAEIVYERATDDRYTPLSSNGADIAMLAIKAAEDKLNQLVSIWQVRNGKVRLPSARRRRGAQ